ncbi:hypothetical protein GKZ68_20105 [Hymenobacter sp. BRD128]|uniref:hypothetical protein n=1 Tax=Hymenobacter sp. BRD128 TaxID=2675878 RepID=UPI001564D6FC|nr:hypothetical protein [Hymenobacter sp. BRD128]QKG58730.1 hypothetical protein GKZ68_20105 [Hymenobacter sp. BRD128]
MGLAAAARAVGAAHPAAPPADAPVQAARTELLLDPATDEVQVQALPADTAVVLLIRHEGPGLRNKPRYVLQQYGANLHLRREVPVDIPPEYEVQRLCAEPGIVYALFRVRETTGKLLALAYDAHGGQVRLQPFDTKLCREVVGLKAMAGRLLANVTLTDQLHQTVLLLDVASGQFQFLPSLYEPLDTELTSVADRPAGHAEFVLSQSNGRKQRLQLKRLSAEHGQLLSSEFVQTESERSLLTAQLSPPEDTTARLLAGTYGLRDVHYAQGLFATDLTARAATAATGKPALRFYDFKRFKHFFDYLNPAREARLRDRTARREAREASPVHWHFHLLLHEMLRQPDGGYTLVAEVYTPQYNYSAYGSGMPLSPYSLTGRNAYNALGGYTPYSSYGSNRAFTGFRTSHVLVCGFDKRGNLLWDNTFVVGPGLVRSGLEEAVQPLVLADGHMVLAYLLDNELHYKRIRQGEPSPNDTKVELLTSANSQAEKVLDVQQPDLLPWGDNKFIASGFQRIKVDRGAERQVFFLQALTF